MELIALVITISFRLGPTLGVGASIFTLTHFIVALHDGTIDEGEKRLMHVDYFVLRIGMALIALGLIGSLAFSFLQYGVMGLGSFAPQYLMQWTLLIIITLNAILMTKKIMPTRYGAAVAGGSWLSLFFVTELPLAGMSYLLLCLYYAAFVVVFFIVYEFLKKKFLPPRPTPPSSPLTPAQ